jgi:hypothetical protein
LFIRRNDEWSQPIKGVGGAAFVSKESNGLYTSDECFKKALTDSISVACKALGVGADIYFSRDKGKYGNADDDPDIQYPADIAPPKNTRALSEPQINRLHAIRKSAEISEDTLKKLLMKHFNKDSTTELTRQEYDFICQQMEELKTKQKSA